MCRIAKACKNCLPATRMGIGIVRRASIISPPATAIFTEKSDSRETTGEKGEAGVWGGSRSWESVDHKSGSMVEIFAPESQRAD